MLTVLYFNVAVMLLLLTEYIKAFTHLIYPLVFPWFEVSIVLSKFALVFCVVASLKCLQDTDEFSILILSNIRYGLILPVKIPTDTLKFTPNCVMFTE